ncbi:PDZ domain-containing protein [Pelagibius litoralis]|uniref:PDZ domain-containing protein n=1 Tax=Pelagibius litoralis TaxID=374515 RepID=A0A967KEM6_9PROT|nr:trypsin-like peptidase domain-containing protein [Pelagibius litoralis]NIA70830.1 PDZ domain-containing protein [Pelagibius litoralis]
MAARTRPGLLVLSLVLGWALAALPSHPVAAANFEPVVLNSIVSVLPLWPGHPQGGQPQLPPGVAPEGTAVAIASGGYLVTANHVVARALSIKVRLPDGRELPAELVGRDPASDLALLKIAADLPPLPYGPEPALASPVCAVGNQFGLDLSVTCGVVSAVHRAGTGFNPIEDFIQTDAAMNPGASGGALVDPQGRLVGLLSAIFTKDSDANIGVNFAASAPLVRRVVEDLIAYGEVRRGKLGLGMAALEPEERERWTGLRLWGVQPGGAGAAAGLKVGDLVTAVDGRPVRKLAEATSAIQMKRPGEVVEITVLRDEQLLTLRLTLAP